MNIGDILSFGHYEQDANESNGPEKIEWIVLDVQDGKALLLSKYGLEMMQYHTERADVTWETCALRSWLNGDFLQTAFSAEEQSSILTTSVDNHTVQGIDDWNAPGGNITQDKLFLLSWPEATRYLGSVYWKNGRGLYPNALMSPTAHAVKNGAFQHKKVKTPEGSAVCWWWLRSAGSEPVRAASVNSDGTMFDYYVNTLSGCVRPAFWLDLGD